MRIIRTQFRAIHGLRNLLHSMVAQVCQGGRTAEISRRRRGMLFSTVAVSSDDAKSVQRSNKRLPKHERKIIVESFVNKYRTLNAGKFPAVSLVKKEVGGSFYVIREILQSLEYNLVHNHDSGISGDLLVEKKGAVNKIIHEQEISQAEGLSFSHSRGESRLFEVEEVSHVEEHERISFYQQVNHLSNDETEKHTESRQMEEMVSYSEKALLEDALNPSAKEDKDTFIIVSKSLEAEGNGSMPYTGEPVLGDEEKDAKSCQGAAESDISTSNLTNDQKSPNYDGLRESSLDNSDDNNLQKNPSIWTNLRSFADSIFSMWRKR